MWFFPIGVFPRELAGSVADIMKQVAVAMENGEYDFDGTSEKKVTYFSLQAVGSAGSTILLNQFIFIFLDKQFRYLCYTVYVLAMFNCLVLYRPGPRKCVELLKFFWPVLVFS